MKARAAIFVMMALFLSACAQEKGPPVSIVELRILAPLPGSDASVAYFSIENRGDAAITISRVDSPQFGKVKMHETMITDGVSRMRPLESFRIDAAAIVEFRPGGKHLMLMMPTTNTVPGSPVTLEFHYDDALIIINATMQTRLPNE